MKLAFSQKIIDKYSNIEVHENPSGGSEKFHVDGHGQDNTRFL